MTRCPDLFAPMPSGDGWLLRLKPRLARLSAAHGRQIAEQVGIMELTGRGNLQLRGLTPASAARFARFAVAAGLASADPAVERRRSILLSPLAGDAACAVAAALECQIAKSDALAALPAKFGFAVDAGAPFGLGAVAADVMLRATKEGWRVGLHGEAGSLAVEPDRAAAAVALDWLSRGEPHRPAYRADTGSEMGRPVIGWLAESRAFGVGLPFGVIASASLDRLCRLAQRFGDGVLHLTPWRAILLSGIAAGDVARLLPELDGLIVTPDDPRRSISACVGSLGCKQGSVDTRADAALLLAGGVRAGSIHVSGCARGCAHPGPAVLTLVGRDGRYGLVQAGRPGDTPHSDGHSIADLVERLGPPQGAQAGV